ncbi:MAG TPA: Uma2 family endonuclease [Solirubrobacteraceae bacterium]|jgi:Uma2 family endonuclease|nr:Uma2 family endonuclease [Solirubrobacteraceae bacterium]
MATVAHPRVVHPRVETWEFDALQENRGWDMDYELIAGEAVLVPPIGESASMAQGELYLALRKWQDDTAEPGVLLQDVFVAPPGKNRLAPDMSWWSGGAGRRPIQPPGALKWGMRRGVPDLIVEVLSPSTRANDEGIKRELYMSSGVRELWLVDPDACTVIRVRPGVKDELLGDGDTLRSDLLVGFELAVARIFSPPHGSVGGDGP